ncbi:Alpha-L-iduronidase [Chelonia mydas]|uniref:Alpha-L-iduronidase n=1 Tax=Chelonia mydas TaxID=8469 RepID=M7BKW9_CHEMY|nr:Alpha-L-iduronidase [Chelonia mydas]
MPLRAPQLAAVPPGQSQTCCRAAREEHAAQLPRALSAGGALRTTELLLAVMRTRVANGKLHYNFTSLDNLMDLLWKNKLIPGFELMGSLSGYFTDFEDKKQVIRWKSLIALLAKRYIGGLALKSALPGRIWGTVDTIRRYWPPGAIPECSIVTALDSTLNSDARLSAVALTQGGATDDTAYRGAGSSLHILEQETEAMEQIQKLFPNFTSVPIYNDEADPLVGWSVPQTWRADVTYAAMVVKVIIQHQNLLISKANNTINYTLLSNDNAFMNYHPHYFTQRTLTARFQMNNTKPPHVQMVRKPVLTVMGLLALLGENQVFADIISKDESADTDTVGVLATAHTPAELQPSDSWQATILIYASDDNQTSSNISAVTVNITHFPRHADLVYVTYYLDNNLTNPYLEWKKVESPDFPSVKQFQQIRDAEDPVVTGPFPFPGDGRLILKQELPLPSVFLIHVCARPHSVPNQVAGVYLIPLTKGQVAVLWDDDCVASRCLKTYEVEFSPDGKAYRRINARDTIFTLWVYSPGTKVSGFYRVRAVDYWSKPGLFSIPVQYIEALA